MAARTNKARETSFKVRRDSDVCTTLDFTAQGHNDEFWVLAASDRHWDNPKSNRALQKEHLDEARDRRAAVIDIGDLFCMMQLPGDRRATKGGTRPEDEKQNYFDRVNRGAIQWFSPYAKNIAILGEGNHETAVLKYTTSSPTERLAEGLQLHGSPCVAMGYRGWIRIVYRRSTQRFTKLVYFHHGEGGGAPVTRGIINASRRAVYCPQADIVLSGHIHKHLVTPIERFKLSQNGTETADEQLHIQLPTYKQAHAGQSGGWEHERGIPPWSQGAVWLRFFVKNEQLLVDDSRAR